MNEFMKSLTDTLGLIPTILLIAAVVIAIPFAITVTISFVDVSPSILNILNVVFISVDNALRNISDDMAQSVVMNTSIVAISGCIIPDPFAIPPILHSVLPTLNFNATVFSFVSVVIIPSAA